jgi:hypothetical protein
VRVSDTRVPRLEKAARRDQANREFKSSVVFDLLTMWEPTISSPTVLRGTFGRVRIQTGRYFIAEATLVHMGIEMR